MIMNAKMNEALAFLSEQYSVPHGEIVMDGGRYKVIAADGTATALLPWRVERRFFELKNLILNKTLERVSTLRFASITAGGSLKEQLARELDLAAWMLNEKIISLYAVCAKDVAANVIVKFGNDVSASIECSTKLPADGRPIDRHEIIAGRGIASDQAVDTQIPQYSIYAFTDKGEERYTDVDSELFGFSNDEIWIIRAAFAVLSNPGLSAEWNSAEKTMNELAAAVFESDRSGSVIKF